MDSSVSGKDEIWFLRVCHHVPHELYPLYRRLGGPQSRSERVRNISPLLGFDPRTFQPVASHYTYWALSAPEIYFNRVKVLTEAKMGICPSSKIRVSPPIDIRQSTFHLPLLCFSVKEAPIHPYLCQYDASKLTLDCRICGLKHFRQNVWCPAADIQISSTHEVHILLFCVKPCHCFKLQEHVKQATF